MTRLMNSRPSSNELPGFAFTGLGTHWTVTVDGGFTPETGQSVLDFAENFEERFSRFLSHSEVNAFRGRLAGEYEISAELGEMLGRAARLRAMTGGAYDPVAGVLLERAGYGGKGLKEIASGVLPEWRVESRRLFLSGSAAFDLGGIAKGYCIDRIAGILQEAGHSFFLVEGGGDMYGTTKADGSGWRVAIEYPGKPNIAAALVSLQYQGLAVSDRHRRRFGRHHHLIHARAGESVLAISGCAALAASAWDADCTTSGLFFAAVEDYPAIARELGSEYLVFQGNGTALISSSWPGEVF